MLCDSVLADCIHAYEECNWYGYVRRNLVGNLLCDKCERSMSQI